MATFGHLVRFVALKAALAASVLAGTAVGLAHAEAPPADAIRIVTHQSYVEDTMRGGDLPLADPKAMFGVVFAQLAERVKVYPTESYYYFSFLHKGVRFAGNIRLDAKDRDQGKVHFAYFEDLSEWREEPPISYIVLDRSMDVALEKTDKLVYRMTHAGKSVVFELNDLSGVTPPPHAITAEEAFIGPVFDDSAIRFFLVFNRRLKVFHYVLDETVPLTEGFLGMRQNDRILIGKRSGFAFYQDPKRDRKILIGVFEGNARVNNAFDGPFDQLPDSFIVGDTLRDAIIAFDPNMKGRIDRFGGLDDGSGRYLIAPYTYYRGEDELLPFHACATNPRIPADDFYACFSMDWVSAEISAVQRLKVATAANGAARPAKAQRRHATQARLNRAKD